MSKKELSVVSEAELALLDNSFPVVEQNDRLVLPRMGMLSKDIVEETGTGKNKKIKVIEASGTFYLEEGMGEDIKKTYIEGDSVDGIIVFHRKQLKYFDKSLEKFISSPVFDNDEQVIPLYLDKRVIARGTKEELQAKYPALTQKGKKTSDLKEHKILYVLYDGILRQMNLSISSGWAFSKYAGAFRTGSPATVVTAISSTEETNGSNTYRKMTFTNKRSINAEELEQVKEAQALIKGVAQQSAEYFLSQSTKEVEADEDMKQLAGAKGSF